MGGTATATATTLLKQFSTTKTTIFLPIFSKRSPSHSLLCRRKPLQSKRPAFSFFSSRTISSASTNEGLTQGESSPKPSIPDLCLYNTMTRQKEVFRPRVAGKVGMYVCGVTTYDLSHIGHARVYVTFDCLYR